MDAIGLKTQCLLSFRHKKRRPRTSLFYYMAEKEGFEPSIQLPIYTLSRGAPSATQPLLRFVLPVKNRRWDYIQIDGPWKAVYAKNLNIFKIF